LMERLGDVIRLTAQGRLLSNEVFERFISVQTSEAAHCEAVLNFT
jgi:hypothetical protein